MRRFLVWYLPQAALFAFGFYAAMTRPGMTTFGAIITGVIMAAAYTGGANLVISLLARLRANRGQSRRESDGLGTGRRFLGESAQDGQGARIDKQLR